MLKRREAVEVCNQEMCDIAISIINEYVNDRLFISDYISQTNYGGSKEHFEIRSYARWSAYEIVDRLNDEAERLPPHMTGSLREPVPPVDIIAGFIDDLDRYISYGCNEKHERIFNVAKDVAEDIILLFL